VTVNWAGYEPYMPPHPGPLLELTRRQARECFEHLTKSLPDRIQQLQGLFATNGLPLGVDCESIQQIDDWFRVNVEANPAEPGRLRNIWYALIADLGLLLGSIMVQRHPHLRWEMLVGGKREVSYQRHVIVGFSRAYPRFYVDPAFAISTYAHAIIESEDVRQNLFMAMLQATDEDA
jgi:hypothetical protein